MSAEPAAAEHPTTGAVTYRICFVPSRDIFSSGSNPLRLLNELGGLGPCNVVAHTLGFPTLADIDPEKCYVYWHVILTTDRGADAIRDVFVFVRDDCKLRIEPIAELDDSGVTRWTAPRWALWRAIGEANMLATNWNDSYALGIAQIDEHHWHLIAMLNDAFGRLGVRDRIGTEKAIEELVDYAANHFSAEERLMSEHNYPHANLHRQQHAYFIKQISIYRRELTAGRKTLSLDLIVFLKDWLLDHISKSDRAYAEVIRPQLGGSAPQGADVDVA